MYDPFDSFRHYRDQIRQLSEPLSIVKQMQEAALEERKRLIGGIDIDLTDQWTDMASSIGRYAEELKARESHALSAINEVLGASWRAEIASLSDTLKNAFVAARPEEFIFESLTRFQDDMQSLSREILKYGRASDLTLTSIEDQELDEAREEIGEIRANSRSPHELVAALVKWMENANPVLKGLVIHLLWPVFLAILSNVLTPEIQEWWKGLEEYPKREATKIVSREANEWYESETLASRRIVKAAALFVRDGPSKKSGIVAKLPLGTIVRLIEKGRHWSLVEYYDPETGSMKEGWVFSRYVVAIRA